MTKRIGTMDDEFLAPDPGFNLPMARKVLEFVTEHHDDYTFDMNVWYRPHHVNYHGECGTSACLAGTAVMLSPDASIGVDPVDEYRPAINGLSMSFAEAGARVLGLNRLQRSALFYGTNEEAVDMLTRMVQLAEASES